MPPAKHPLPLVDLSSRTLPVTLLDGPWKRLYRRDKEALFFNRSGIYRFNAPGGEFGILYLGEDTYASFIETYGWQTGIRAVTKNELFKKHLAQVSSSKPLKCVDLSGNGLTQIGADARICIGSDYLVSQQWSLALWNHPDQPDGILYPARHDPSRRSLALFDRNNVTTTLSSKDTGSFLHPDNLPLLAAILKHYNFGLI